MKAINKRAEVTCDALHETLMAAADPNDANAMEAYMKDHFQFLGIRSVTRRSCLKNVLATHPIHADDTEFVVRLLWKSKFRELHYCAQEIAFRHKLHHQASSIDLIEWLIVTNSWWDTVDFVAPNLAGGYFQRFPDQIKAVTGKWNRSSNLWLVRSSLLFQLKYRLKTDAHLLHAYILPHLDSREFFIQKAIGWALREYSKYNPDFVRTIVFTLPLKSVSKREAVKYI